MKISLFTTLLLLITISSCEEVEIFKKKILEDQNLSESEKRFCLSHPTDQKCQFIFENNDDDDDDSIDDDNGDDDSTTNTTSYVDTYTQNQSEAQNVDILWVIDNSGSMSNEQEALAENFSQFIEEFITKDVNFRMAITTTDSRNGMDGEPVGDIAQLTSEAASNDQDQFITDFEDQVLVGTNGSGDEMGLHTSETFFTVYPEFIRENAQLAIVYVSDEEDHSELVIDHYKNFVKDLKPNSAKVKVYSITNSQGSRYKAISNSSGGIIGDIDGDFHNILSSFGTQIVNLLHSFPVRENTIESTVKVYVDGILQNLNAHYTLVNNQITFLESYIPAEGAIIEVKYEGTVSE